jgi:hypothetical protein
VYEAVVSLNVEEEKILKNKGSIASAVEAREIVDLKLKIVSRGS